LSPSAALLLLLLSFAEFLLLALCESDVAAFCYCDDFGVDLPDLLLASALAPLLVLLFLKVLDFLMPPSLLFQFFGRASPLVVRRSS
jgi:hypothetical protein